jgi:hypothetical protein
MQILFVAGVMVTIGMKSTIAFFLNPHNYKVGFFLWHQKLQISLMGSGDILNDHDRIILTEVYRATLASYAC